VIFPKVGAALLTEKRRILTRESAFDNNVMGLVPGPRILSAFLHAALLEVRLADVARTGAIPSVNQQVVARIKIPVPSLAEQGRMAVLLQRSREQRSALGAEVAALRGLRSNLLATLRSGEVGIPESFATLFELKEAA